MATVYLSPHFFFLDDVIISLLFLNIVILVRIRNNGEMKMPADIQYSVQEFPALSNEELEKLRYFRPETLQEAGKIPGITPAGRVYIFHFVRKYHQKQRKAEQEQEQEHKPI